MNTHGHSLRSKTSPTYNTWRGMIDRCKNGLYRKTGVTVCKRWHSFDNFLADMGERPAGCEIDRRDCRGNYTPKNCRWLTVRENRQQRRTTILTPTLRRKIRRLAKRKSHRQMAITVGVSKSCITDFLSGEAWGQS